MKPIRFDIEMFLTYILFEKLISDTKQTISLKKSYKRLKQNHSNENHVCSYVNDSKN